MRLYLFFCLLFLVPSVVSSQSVQRARKYLDTLCSPQMHGRGATFKGDSIAAAYLQDRFIEFGVKSFGSSFQQSFTYPINTFPSVISLNVDGNDLKPGTDFIAHPATHSGMGEVSIIYLDTSIFSNPKVAKSFRRKDISGKAIVLQSSDMKRLSMVPELMQKVFTAKCIIELQKKLTASLAGVQYPLPYFQIREEQFSSNAKKVNFVIDADLIRSYKSQNVIGYIEGKSKLDSFIVFSAHYDHLGRMGKDVFFPGANDNGSGVAMLLELARFYSMPENKPEYSIVFMLFAAEEAGLIGSKHFVENPIFPLSKIKFLVNMDLLGTGDTGMMVVNGAVFTKQYQLMTSLNEENGYLPEIKKRGEAANSDHYFFTKAGVPAFFIYTMGGISAYHDVYDIPTTLPFSEFEDVFRLLVDFVSEL